VTSRTRTREESQASLHPVLCAAPVAEVLALGCVTYLEHAEGGGEEGVWDFAIQVLRIFKDGKVDTPGVDVSGALSAFEK